MKHLHVVAYHSSRTLGTQHDGICAIVNCRSDITGLLQNIENRTCKVCVIAGIFFNIQKVDILSLSLTARVGVGDSIILSSI